VHTCKYHVNLAEFSTDNELRKFCNFKHERLLVHYDTKLLKQNLDYTILPFSSKHFTYFYVLASSEGKKVLNGREVCY
jgi:hypothetical protein